MSKTTTITCQCSSQEHNLIISPDKEDNTIYLHLFLETDNFLKRTWKALKYAFGYKCTYGHFSEIILDTSRIIELKLLLDNFLDKSDHLVPDIEAVFTNLKSNPSIQNKYGYLSGELNKIFKNNLALDVTSYNCVLNNTDFIFILVDHEYDMFKLNSITKILYQKDINYKIMLR
jgi:hypothetical protein